MQDVCPLDSIADSIVALLTFDTVQKAGNITNLAVPLDERISDFSGGFFSLFYANCEPSTLTSFKIRVSLYNVRSNGKKDYLAVGEDMLPLVFMVGLKLNPPHATHLLACILVACRPY